jgi:hypothetical protein
VSLGGGDGLVEDDLANENSESRANERCGETPEWELSGQVESGAVRNIGGDVRCLKSNRNNDPPRQTSSDPSS